MYSALHTTVRDSGEMMRHDLKATYKKLSGDEVNNILWEYGGKIIVKLTRS